MSDKKISQLSVSSTLSPAAIIPVTQTDTMTGLLATFGVTASTLWSGANGTGVGTYYSFPNDPGTPVTLADIGKLAMNDGSGTAKVYATSPAVGSQQGIWVVTLDTALQGAMNSNTEITFTDLNSNSYTVSRSSWYSGTPTPFMELQQIEAAINNLGINVTATDNGSDTVYIKENGGYQGYTVKTSNFPTGAFSVSQLSLPVQPESPTAFPLGKIINVVGSTASLDSAVFNTANYGSINFSDPTVRNNFAAMIAVPGAGGTVVPFDLSRYTTDNSFLYAFRDQFLGLILGVDTTGTIVTVLHLNALSPILNTILKGIWYSDNH